MKFLLLTLFVAAVASVPIPDEDPNNAVEMIVNGVPEGEPLEIGHIVDIQMKEHVDGQVVAATDLLHPYTAVGIAEAINAADSNLRDGPEDVPEAVVLPSPAAPEVVVPEPFVMPTPSEPEVAVPEPVVLPSPAAPEVVMPEPIVLPSPAVPEVVKPEPVVVPSPAEVAPELPVALPQFPEGDLYNDGIVQVQVNGPEEPGMLATLQSWFNMVINYFNNGVQTSSQQIV